jgi:hypothetical protein
LVSTAKINTVDIFKDIRVPELILDSNRITISTKDILVLLTVEVLMSILDSRHLRI